MENKNKKGNEQKGSTVPIGKMLVLIREAIEQIDEFIKEYEGGKRTESKANIREISEEKGYTQLMNYYEERGL